MSWEDRIAEAQGSIIAALASASVAGFIWLVRRVFTNQKQIELMQREIQMRDERRAEDREAIKTALDGIKTDIQDVRADVKTLFQRGQ